MSGSTVNANILYASATGDTQSDPSLTGVTSLQGVYSYGTSGVYTTYTVDTDLPLAAGAVLDAGSYSKIDLTAAMSGNSPVTFNIGSAFTAPDGTAVPSGHATLEFGAAAIGGSFNTADTINFNGPLDAVIIDSGSIAPAVVNGLGGGDTIDFAGLAYNSQATYSYSTGIGGAGPGIYARTGKATAVLVASVTLNNVSATNVKAVADSAGGTLVEYVCFARGTRIAAANGAIAVEALRIGDSVATQRGDTIEYRPVKWIGHRRVNLVAHPQPDKAAPIRIRRDAFAENVPCADLLVSPDHAIFADGKLICARQLINGATVVQDTRLVAVEYFHVELDTHALLLAEGLATESYLDTGNRNFFANAPGSLLLHPDLTDEAEHPNRASASCAPFVWDAEAVQPVWQQLADRAAMLGRPVHVADTTSSPDLCVVAQGRTLQPISAKGVHRFVVPNGVTEVRLVSRAAAPTDARPWMEDRRRLGVYVERIMLRCGAEVLAIPVDHPDLTRGWWAVERRGAELRRWTNGDAVLPLPVSNGPFILEIVVGDCGMTYPAAAQPGYRRAA